MNARDGEPLSLVQVELAGTEFARLTGDDGTFRLTGVPPGELRTAVDHRQFLSVRTPVTLEAGEIAPSMWPWHRRQPNWPKMCEVSEDVFDGPGADGIRLHAGRR